MRPWCQEFVTELDVVLKEWTLDTLSVHAHWSVDQEEPDYHDDMTCEEREAHPRSEPEIFVHFAKVRMRNVHVRISVMEENEKRFGFITPCIQGCGGPTINFLGPYETWVSEARSIIVGYSHMMQTFERDHLGRDIRWAKLDEVRVRADSNTQTSRDVYDLLHDLSEAEQSLVSARAKVSS